MLRERLFLIGIIVLLLGIQFRRVESYTLTAPVSRMVQERMQKARGGASALAGIKGGYDTYSTSMTSMPQLNAGGELTFSPPRWLGFSFVSVGAVLILTCPCFRS